MSAQLPPAWMTGGEPSYLLGTDSLGRCVLSRLIYSARTAVVVALIAATLAAMIGGALRPQSLYAQTLADVRAACASDVQKLCAGVPSGGGRIIACLKQHQAEVSDGCKQAIAKAMSALPARLPRKVCGKPRATIHAASMPAANCIHRPMKKIDTTNWRFHSAP